jgi:hypothetical protein
MHYPVSYFTLIINELPVALDVLGAADGHSVLISLSQFPDPDKVDDETYRNALTDLIECFLPQSIGKQWGQITCAYNDALGNLCPQIPQPETEVDTVHARFITLNEIRPMDPLRPGGTPRTWHLTGDYMFIAQAGKDLSDFLPPILPVH